MRKSFNLGWLFIMKKSNSITLKFFLMVVIFLVPLFSSTNGFSLGWADKEWISSGCPSKILGVWKARSSPDKAPHKMQIVKGMILLKTREGSEKFYFYGESKFVKQARFLQVSLKEGNPESGDSIVWKIRPHLTWKSSIKNSNAAKNSDCLIKVLRFKNEKQARFNKYQTWDIYEKSSD
jgi:hypothetical protein